MAGMTDRRKLKLECTLCKAPWTDGHTCAGAIEPTAGEATGIKGRLAGRRALEATGNPGGGGVENHGGAGGGDEDGYDMATEAGGTHRDVRNYLHALGKSAHESREIWR